MRKSKRLVHVVAGAVLAAAVAGATSSPSRAQAERGGLIESGDSPGLLLLYTGDVIGYVDPCG